MPYSKIILHSGKENSLLRFHPWLFSGAIKKITDTDGKDVILDDGDVVEVYSCRNMYLGTGHYQHGSIAVRMLTYRQTVIDEHFWTEKIASAYRYRNSLKLTGNDKTNAFRLVYAEGDGMPGLIIDYYNGTAVMQAHTVGMHRVKPALVKALQAVFGKKLIAVYDKSGETLSKHKEHVVANGYLYKAGEPVHTILENGNHFYIDWEQGQKTGFFIDQRDNRELLGRYAAGRTVLNAFCYTGGFSVSALNNGAKTVHSLDSSKRAMELTKQNIELNNFEASRHECIVGDVMEYIKKTETNYDLLVLDPPAFAKHKNARHNAVQAYKRLNAMAMEKIRDGGILFTFSCSQVVDRTLFCNTIMAAAIEAGRTVRVMHHLSQPPDHPMNIFHPEGEYLKGLVVYVGGK